MYVVQAVVPNGVITQMEPRASSSSSVSSSGNSSPLHITGSNSPPSTSIVDRRRSQTQMVKIEPSHGARASGGHLPLHAVLDEQLVIQNQNSQARIQVVEGEDEPCPICGDKNTGYHYGIRTCESCKVSSYRKNI